MLLNEDKAPEKGTTNAPQDSKGEDQPSGTTNLGIHQNSSESAGKTLATIGNGSITVGGEATTPEGLNRDVEAVEKELYAVDRVKGDFDLTVENKTLEEVAEQVSELLENFNKLSPDEQALLQAQLSAMDEAIQKGKASDNEQERKLAEKIEADKELLLAKFEEKQAAQDNEPLLAAAPTLSGKSFEEMQNEFAAVKGALSGWYTDIQQGGEQSYEDGLYRGEVSAYAYNSAPAFGSETDYSGATAFYQTQREAAYAGLGLWPGASSGSLLDYAGWTAASMTNETWQGVQFAAKAATLGLFSNPFDGSSYHSLIGDGTLFGSPQSFTGAMGVEQGKVASYFAGIEGLAVLGLKGAKYFGKADEVPEVKSSLDKNLFDAGGESDFYNKADNAGKTLTETTTYYRVEGGGSGAATSQNRIAVNQDGSISINSGCSGQLCVSTRNAEHASYYLTNRRPDGSVVVFEMDNSLHNFIMEEAVPQRPIPGIARDPNAPKIVDDSKPGTALELPKMWNSLIEEHSSKAKVYTQEEFLKRFGNGN
ncbi:hypothetical protein [uncultured Rheinheimera sp.]|uniref:hypothetical protein n=1 Tax=uncultured Rheinheimera sp. TaxID=400532 RepID=UPI0025927A8A|nr:hypothetical protein [uncultured Rheinheimera sp.]